MTKVIFFDMYQTLVDTDISDKKEIKKKAFTQVFSNYLIEIGVEEILASEFQNNYFKLENEFYLNHDRSTRHHDFKKLLSQVFIDYYNVKIEDKDLDKLIWDYRLMTRGYSVLYKGVSDTLQSLSMDYDIYLASYTQSSFSLMELEELGIKKYFKGFIFSSDIGYRKSSKEFYNKCIEISNTKSENCIMVGDNKINDVYMASSVSMKTIWIKNPITMNDDKELDIIPDAELDIQNFASLSDIIKKL